MDVKPGYKQTDVGIIPDDWQVESIDSIADPHKRWSFTGGPFGSNLKSSDYVQEGIRVIQLQNIGDGEFRDDSAIYTTAKKADELLSCNIYPGEIILSKMGDPVARACIVPREDSRYLMCSDGIRLAVDGRRFNTYFIYMMINDAGFRERANNAGTGSTRKRIGLTELRKLEIGSPLLPEQDAIAEALSDADAYIESLEQLIAKKRLIKQGAMQELLTGKRRLPGFSGEWEEIPLGEVSEIVMGQSPSSSHYNQKGQGLPLIQGNADIANRKTIKRAFTTEITKRGLAGDIIMSVRAPVGEVARTTFDVCLGRGVCAIRYQNDYLYHYLIFSESTWARLSKGSTFDAVNSTDVKGFNVLLPTDEEEQLAIAEVLGDMDVELAVFEEKLKKAQQLKQGMMQELLTGRTRLI